jgi:predicted AlkP superfamily phosphohydrolase/phosphomutase
MSKTLVIGLDGVPLDLIQKWSEAGELPVLARFFENGAFGPLRSTTPPTSAAAWSSFVTGKNPGQTGVYDFLYREGDSYNFSPANGHHRDGQSLWQILSAAGKRVGVVNVPLSYPAEPVNGFMITGWMTPYRAQDFAYPSHIIDDLEAAVGPYQIYPLKTFSERNPEAYFAASHRLLEMRSEAALYLMEKHPWDLFMTVFFDTDRILHQAWHYLDPDHPWHDGKRPGDHSRPIRRYFRQLDASIGRLIEQAGDDTLVMIMSDHGMGSAHNMIVLNNWLMETGWLQLKERPVTRLKRGLFGKGFTLKNIHQFVDRLGLAKQAEYRSLYSVDAILKQLFLSFYDVDWPGSRAYSFGRHVGPLYLNVKGREPEGIVKPGRDYERVRDELAAQARQLRDPRTGRRLVGQVLYREEVYSGDHLEEAPDLILIPRDERDIFFGLSDFGSNEIVQPMYRYSGMHRDHGLLLMMGPQVKPAAHFADAAIIDLAPTILAAMGVPIPQDMDGRTLGEALLGEAAFPTVTRPASVNGQSKAAGYSPEEARQIERRLRSMGYLG